MARLFPRRVFFRGRIRNGFEAADGDACLGAAGYLPGLSRVNLLRQLHAYAEQVDVEHRQWTEVHQTLQLIAVGLRRHLQQVSQSLCFVCHMIQQVLCLQTRLGAAERFVVRVWLVCVSLLMSTELPDDLARLFRILRLVILHTKFIVEGQECSRLSRFRFGSAYFFYDLYSMYIVYNARIFDKLNMKSLATTENLYAMIPTKRSGELSFFTPTIIDNQIIPSFWQYIKFTKLMVFHHMFIGTYGLLVISSWRGGLGDCVFSFMFLMEMSTPFVSFRAVLSIMNLKRSKLYVINGLLMLVSFLVFRILMLPTLLYYYSSIVNLSFLQAIMKLPLGCKLSIVALFLPQFYWFHLMMRAAMRVRR